jgi:excisionase family DNA binding protein
MDYTIKSASTLLSCDRITLYGKIKSGELPAYRIGRTYRIRAEDIEKIRSSSDN